MTLPSEVRSLIDNAGSAARGDLAIAFQRIAAARRALKRGGWSSGDDACVARQCFTEVRSRLKTFSDRLSEILDAAAMRLDNSDQQMLLREFTELRDELLQSLERFLAAQAKNSVMTRNAQFRAFATERAKMSNDMRHKVELVLLRFSRERDDAPDKIGSAANQDELEKTKKLLLAKKPIAIVVLVFIVTGAVAGLWNDSREAYHSIFSRSESSAPISTQERTPDRNRLPSLQVTFRDGRGASVDAYFRVHIERSDVLRVHTTTGPNYDSFLDTKIRATLFSVLEKLTLEQARTRRNDIRSEVLATVAPTLKTAGFTLDDFGITEIRETQSR